MRLSEFAAALQDAEAPMPAGLVTWNGSDPQRRFAVYRNNVRVSLVDVLADTYPVTQALVGDAFFRAMAGVFVQQALPTHPILAEYGGDFAAFVSGFPPAAVLPYLADVARLEWCRLQALHAADVAVPNPAELTPWLDDPEKLAGARLQLHPGVQVLRSDYAMVSLWAAHQEEDPATALGHVDPLCPEAALILRCALTAEVWPLDLASALFVGALQQEQSFASAVEQALQVAPDLDLGILLGHLLACSAIIGIHA